MIFVPGTSYYTLSEEEYETLFELLEEFGADYGLGANAFLNDFELVDGTYYALMDPAVIDDDESLFLDDFGLGNRFDYKKSTQSTSPI